MNRLKVIYSICMLFCFLSMNAFASSSEEVILSYDQKSLEYILKDFGGRYDLIFNYSSAKIPLEKKYTLQARLDSKEAAVELICKRVGMDYRLRGNMVLLRMKPMPKKRKRKLPVPKPEPEVQLVEEKIVYEMYTMPADWSPAVPEHSLPNLPVSRRHADETWFLSRGYGKAKDGGLYSVYHSNGDYKGHEYGLLWNNNRGSHEGRAWSLMFNRTKKDMAGSQFSILGNFCGGGTGKQISLIFNASSGALSGNQYTVLFNRSGEGSNLFNQISLIANTNRGTVKRQLALFNRNAGDAGRQIGLVNLNKKDADRQTGIINTNGGIIGRQIGLINKADSVTMKSLGLLNFIRKGYNRFELAYTTDFATELSFRFGTARLHTIMLASFDWRGGQEYFFDMKDWQLRSSALGLGFGGAMVNRGRYMLVQEGTVSAVLRPGSGWERGLLLGRYSLKNIVRLGKKQYKSSLVLGFHLNIMKHKPDLLDPPIINGENLFTVETWELENSRLNLWPGLSAGFRF